MTGDDPVVLVTCSGISNTGKCTTRAAALLCQRKPGEVEEHIPALSPEGFSPAVARRSQGCRVFVVDGCGDCCAANKVTLHGLDIDIHLIATDCGIVKAGMDEPSFADIDRLAREMARLLRE
ncbi:hypothetical protein AZH53_09510 [Methanomicrobiaceae archaeon CYW5]|uniref:putative zinc-binding protein n=1 Tax=Methanovulcanius yangii TaxID=1789227 RepID=UPI0029C9CD91|nr:putative zinc-binding protein [Methanovulcanius yangii]MBT8508640.1 hypothetical protein [Methanovulcanius yangii]